MRIVQFALIVLIFPEYVLLEPLKGECAHGGRCLPYQPCWPSVDQWNSLNNSVHGRLSVPHLTIKPCLEDDRIFNTKTCHEALEKLGEDPFYLQQFPGGVQSTGMFANQKKKLE